MNEPGGDSLEELTRAIREAAAEREERRRRKTKHRRAPRKGSR